MDMPTYVVNHDGSRYEILQYDPDNNEYKRIASAVDHWHAQDITDRLNKSEG